MHITLRGTSMCESQVKPEFKPQMTCASTSYRTVNRKIAHRRTTRSGPSQYPQTYPAEADSSSNPDTKWKKAAATNSTVRHGEVRRRRRGNRGIKFGAHMTA